MENNFIQMAASADHAVVYTISLIFKHIMHVHITNGLSFKASIVSGLLA